MTPAHSTITLIGMAGAGKSTVGRILAQKRACPFIDTDLLIERRQGRPLQELLDIHGPDGFRRMEEEVLLHLTGGRQVVATGGSSIYSSAGMTHLRSLGPLVLLDLDLSTLLSRVTNLDNRGLVDPDGTGFAALYRNRAPLYNAWADITVPAHPAPEQVAAAILRALAHRPDLMAPDRAEGAHSSRNSP